MHAGDCCGQHKANDHQMRFGVADDCITGKTKLDNGGQQMLRTDSSEHILSNPIYGAVESDDALSDTNNVSVSAYHYTRMSNINYYYL